ncbi:Ig-like domain-containing protein [Undibacterium sp. Jales W-56]|uniref:Ig-like domain-containing protein n=1 Tax=Undibacterium sp. Jales W-56 TaxID=2897325 RepID=UPI0021D2C857|nr:Ig-like domain-containing protein [Undibacterium sp. Jales W-56]MCU6435684.1 Ig-like domain-containing protein [Undibacterium sp. Jales W-56]
MQHPTHSSKLKTLAYHLSLVCALGLGTGCTAYASIADHHEFEATLHVPFRADPAVRTGNESRYFTMEFDFPLLQTEQSVTWRLELVAPDGKVVDRWYGVEKLLKQAVTAKVLWAGRRFGSASMADGIYQVRLTATANDTAKLSALASGATMPEKIVENVLLKGKSEIITQNWPMLVGTKAAPVMPNFVALPTKAKAPLTSATATGITTRSVSATTRQFAAAPNALPYTVYFGNLHSQTNHSDGGGPLSTCTGAQNPQSAALGPTDAYQYAMNRGLDFLMTSEHNHMYDGSASTNLSANPATAKNLFQSGLTAAASFNSAHPNFLGIYGLEWGVISNGGHLNIFNTNELLEWEYNSSNQLIGDTYTAKSDYAALYTLMRSRGWIGQFNHPATSGQFIAGGVDLGYTADGDQAMVLCEVLNTSAFSSNTTETETGRSSYEDACKKALEAGYHVAFSTDQDNHCANWGASYTNRTGVLLPNGSALNSANFIDALKARRVFATMDKNSQLVLTANGHIMGERFSNSGSLNLVANFSSSTGRSATTVEVYEGVPGRNGTVSLLSSTATTTITPAVGEHFYYAKITQDDGNILWSAPVWVTQTTGTVDTTPPTVSASESGNSGTITLAATASDNVGVTKVEFYVDNLLKGTASSAPYSLALNSTTLTNGTHALVAKAYDAANNVGTSSAVSFSVSNATTDTIPPTVSASESGSSGNITLSATASDNVGVTKVEFYVDGSLQGTSTTAPYSMSLASTTLSNGTHSLIAKAYDAANNIGTSSAVSFTVNNTTATQLILNGGFESASASWTASSGVISSDTTQASHAGAYKAWLDGYGATHTDTLYQQVTIPAASTSATLSFWLKIVSNETTTTQTYDTLQVQVRNSSNSVLATLATYSNLNKGSSYLNKTFDLSAYKGQTIRIYFLGVENSSKTTSFLIDDVSLIAQ